MKDQHWFLINIAYLLILLWVIYTYLEMAFEEKLCTGYLFEKCPAYWQSGIIVGSSSEKNPYKDIFFAGIFGLIVASTLFAIRKYYKHENRVEIKFQSAR